MTAFTDFLLARIAEDEAVAMTAMSARWGLDEIADIWREDLDGQAHLVARRLNEDEATHIARHDPARVLAECEAKRAIVEFHKSWPVMVETPPEFSEAPSDDVNSMTFRMSKRVAWLTEQEYRARFGDEPPTAPMLRALAAVYADHPDYRQEWRPA